MKKQKNNINDITKLEKKKKSTQRELLEYLIVIIIGVSLAFYVRSNVGQLFLVDGQSMEPTFQNHDFAVSSIISYKHNSPKIGDIVIVQADTINKKIIKRVEGLPGDTLQIKDGYLYRDGKKINEPYIKEKMTNIDEFQTPYDLMQSAYTVPKGTVFVMGDNRNNSGDSREFGPFPNNKILGKVVLELWNNPFKTY